MLSAFAKCFVCAGEHEGAKHRCAMAGCEKKLEPCDHDAAKCANCGGGHMATSRRCPERMARPQKNGKPSKDMRSSPPTAFEGLTPSTELASNLEGMDVDVATSATGRNASIRSLPAAPVTEDDSIAPQSHSTYDLDLELDFNSGFDSDRGSPTPAPRGKAPSIMSVDDDSATT